MKIAMVMLAAGNSRRFGANKLLYQIEGKPMYQHVLTELLQVRKELEVNRGWRAEITVVTQYDVIGKEAKRLGQQVLYNLCPEKGISFSLKIGLKANLDADAVLFAVSDQPWLTGKTILRLILACMESGKGIGCVSSNGQMGNPCIFKSKYYNELMKLTGDTGGKRIIRSHEADVIICEADKKEIKDMDYKKSTENQA